MFHVNKKVKSVEEISTKTKKEKKLRLMLLILAALLSLEGYKFWIRKSQVEVAVLKESVTIGEPVIKSKLRKKLISREDYNLAGTSEITDENGEKQIVPKYILWKNIDKYEEQSYNYHHPEDSFLTTKSTSSKMQYGNPLIEGMPEGNEEYTLKINSDDIDINQLFPGTVLRFRVAFEVPYDLVKEARRRIDSKKEFDGKSEVLDMLATKGYQISNSGGDSLLEGDNRSMANTAIVSEIIFDNMVAVDMLNSSKESIYKIYIALLDLPLEERIPYLKTELIDDKSGEFRSRITPSTIQLSLTKDQASRMHEYEEEGYKVKYTLIKTADSSDMLRDFVKINNQIMETLKQEKVTKENSDEA